MWAGHFPFAGTKEKEKGRKREARETEGVKGWEEKGEKESPVRRSRSRAFVLVAADSAWTVQGWRCTLLEDIYVSVVASRRLTKSGATCLERRATAGVNQPELTPSHPTRRFRLRRRWQAHVHVHPRALVCLSVCVRACTTRRVRIEEAGVRRGGRENSASEEFTLRIKESSAGSYPRQAKSF